MDHISSDGSTVTPMVLSLAIPNNLVLTMSSLIGTTLAKRRTQNLETLHYYVLCTLLPLLGYLDDQHAEFLESWMAYLDFKEFPDLIEYYTTIGTGTILKEKYTTIVNCTLLKDIKNFTYLTQLYFMEDTSQPNPAHVEYTYIVVKTFYATSDQNPALYNFLAITQDELILWEYHLDVCETEIFLTYTATITFVLKGDVTSHV